MSSIKTTLQDEEPTNHDGIAILATQAFCPNGHNLVRRKDVLFDGHPGISLNVQVDDWEGEIILSPFQGDFRKQGLTQEFKEGSICRITCPECGIEFPVVTECGCKWGGDLISLALRRDLREGDSIILCNAWGCHRSRVMDNWQILSEYVDSADPE